MQLQTVKRPNFHRLPFEFHRQAPPQPTQLAVRVKQWPPIGPCTMPSLKRLMFGAHNPESALIQIGNGLDVTLEDDFAECVESMRYQANIDADFNLGGARGINSTPSFLLNDNPLIGAQPISAFDRAIEMLVEGGELPSNEPEEVNVDDLDIPPFQMPDLLF